MKHNKTLLAAALLVAAVAAGFLIISKSNGGKTSGSSDAAVSEKRGSGKSVSGQTEDAAAKTAERTKNRRSVANEELVAKYGESRTNLSKHASSNIIGILEDAVQMGEMMTSGQASGFGGGGMGMVLGRLNGDLQLTPEQNEKAAEVFKDYQRRQIANQKAAIERLQKDPTPLMKLMLASDAGARGELDDGAYKSAQAQASTDLSGVINPLDRKNFGGGSPLRDPAFVSELRGILDPSQAEKLDASIAQRQTDAQADPTRVPGVEEGNIASLPKKDLEQLDQSIESARKVTTGIKSMMDGMSGLKDLATPPPAPAPAPAPGGN